MAQEIRQGTITSWGTGYRCSQAGSSWSIIATCDPNLMSNPPGMNSLSLMIEFVTTDLGLHFYAPDIAEMRVPASEYDSLLRAFSSSTIQFWESHDMDTRNWHMNLSPRWNTKAAEVLSHDQLLKLSDEFRSLNSSAEAR